MRRNQTGRVLALCLVFLITLAGCAPRIAPRHADYQPPAMSDGDFIMQDGIRLPYKRWEPEVSPRAAVIALHGFNDYAGAYSDLGPLLARHGLLVYAYDQRGFGGTSMRGDWAGTDAMTDDLGTVTELLRAAHPELPVYALGESMGGAVIMTALGGARPPRLDGAVLFRACGLGPQHSGTLEAFHSDACGPHRSAYPSPAAEPAEPTVR